MFHIIWAILFIIKICYVLLFSVYVYVFSLETYL